MAEKIATTERLAVELEKAGAPISMIRLARGGVYDDFRSDSATPIQDLVRDLNIAKLKDLARRALDGEFDAESWEADEWYEKEGRGVLG